MSKSSRKAFGRGFSYHAGAGVGEAVRTITNLGLTSLAVVGVSYVTTRLNHMQLQNDLNNLLKK